jgi:hypothetical protein
MNASLTGRAVIQKRPRVEVKPLRDLIHGLPCFATFPHACNANLGCHPAHYNWLDGDKGIGKKTSDHMVASVCGNAHQILDGKLGLDTLPKHMRQYYWIQAFISTWDYIWSRKLVKVA